MTMNRTLQTQIKIPVTSASKTSQGVWTATVDGVFELYDGMNLSIITPEGSFGGAITLNVNGLGAKPFLMSDQATNPSNGLFASGTVLNLTYVGGNFIVTNANSLTISSYGGVRQTIRSSAVDANNNPTFMSNVAGTTNVDLKATAVPIVASFSAGANEYVAQVTNDITGAWPNLPLGLTSYLTLDRDSNSGAITPNSTLNPPIYGNYVDSSRYSLLHFEGTNGSTSIYDEYGNNWTTAGSAQISTSSFKFGSSSLKLNGTTDYVYASGANFNPSKWTAECFVTLNTVPTTGTQTIFAYTDASGNNIFTLSLYATSTNVKTYISAANQASSGWSYYGSAQTSYAANTPYHIAVSYDGMTIRVFVNGKLDNYAYFNSSGFAAGGNYLVLGASKTTSPVNFFNGYIDEFRLSACPRYYYGFTAPTASFTPDGHQFHIPSSTMYAFSAGQQKNTAQRVYVGEATTSIPYSSALYHFDTDGNDAYGYSNINGLSASSGINTSTYKFGGGSLSSGVNSAIPGGVNPSGFTIEFWFYVTTTTPSTYGFLSLGNFSMGVNLNNSLVWSFTSSAGNTAIAGLTAITLNAWHHFAVTYNGTVYTPYLDGVAGTTTTGSSLTGGSLSLMTTNSACAYAGLSGNGYIDEVRISQKVRYTANFVPSGTAFTVDEVIPKSLTYTTYALNGRYDSGWYPIAGGSNYVKNHNLGFIPQINQYYSPTDSDFNAMEASKGTTGYTSKPTNLTTSISIQTASYQDSAQTLTSGYYRTIANRSW